MLYYPPLSNTNRSIVEQLYNYQSELFDITTKGGVQSIADEIYNLLVDAPTYHNMHDGSLRNSDSVKMNFLRLLKSGSDIYEDVEDIRISVILMINFLAGMYDPKAVVMSEISAKKDKKRQAQKQPKFSV